MAFAPQRPPWLASARPAAAAGRAADHAVNGARRRRLRRRLPARRLVLAGEDAAARRRARPAGPSPPPVAARASRPTSAARSAARYLAAMAPELARAGPRSRSSTACSPSSTDPGFRAGLRAGQPGRGRDRRQRDRRRRRSSPAASTASRSTPDRVLIVDYKTNRPAPEPARRRPARLRDAARALSGASSGGSIPERPVAAAILWTDRPALMEIPSAMLDAAEMQASPRHAHGCNADIRAGAPGCRLDADRRPATYLRCQQSFRILRRDEVFMTPVKVTDANFDSRRARRPAACGRRFLGGVVRALPLHRAGARGDRHRARRQGDHRQAQCRRESRHHDALRRPLDPDADHVQERRADGDAGRRHAEAAPVRLDPQSL